MTEPTLVIGLVASVLAATAGSTVEAQLLLYSDAETSVLVNGEPYAVDAYSLTRIAVPLDTVAGKREERIVVSTGAVSYEVPVTVIGKRDWRWLWSLALPPLAAIGIGVRAKRKRAGNS